MDLPSILRSFVRGSFDKEKQSSASRNKRLIFEKWNHLSSDGSILSFIRHYEFEETDHASEFLLVVLQETHERGLNIDVRKNTGNSRCIDVVVSGTRAFLDEHEDCIENLLNQIETDYNQQKQNRDTTDDDHS